MDDEDPIPETYERGTDQHLADLVLPITLLTIAFIGGIGNFVTVSLFLIKGLKKATDILVFNLGSRLNWRVIN